MPRKLTATQIVEIEIAYPNQSTAELAIQYGISQGYVYAIAHSRGIMKDKTFLSKTIAESHRKLSADEMLEIERLYPFTLSKDIAALFGVSKSTIDGFSSKFGWKKDPEFKLETARLMGLGLKDAGMAHRFNKGHIPANKGKQISDFMDKDQQKRFRSHSFKKGHTPKNHLAIGTEIVMAKDGYVKVKTGEPNKWCLKHRLVWIQHNGPIPKGFNVQFRNGDRQDCSIENLYIISKKQQLKEQNSMYARYPKEIQDNIRAIGRLTRSINKTKNQENDQE